MRRILVLFLLALGTPMLGGCVAGMAVGAAGFAARSAIGKPASNEHLKPEAVSACSARASQYGAVHIIDVERRGAGKMIVWGTADDGKQRRSFECGFGTKITGFRLRAIEPPAGNAPAT
ncbi:MAG TPA: hypothetical protein VJR87_02295 [Allosphingosinicella sp.]|nr:hypothetical protein [Allosphingosinicella sp.]